ncbi:inositol monophosphatase family protein [Antrihabitans cavernicola]|uniref:Inositol-1-monophosphatase n=1 Tax=Antrihabitans cavernicola TaxID=2495913 RepID=A0A5A7SB89_9NOCA|nr:inositol monophosphatase family protein [Spelaeibacter cavernicola]KAA0023398.1 inositol monophosphatase [Spelaeibacter cavernicola]
MPESESENLPGVDLLELRDVAVRIAEEAAAHVRARRPEVFGGVGASRITDDADSVQSKSTPTDPVTVVDTETEEVVRALLARLRPEDRILGEEGGGSSQSLHGIRWVVDPIDGTVNFLYGIPAYAVSVGVQIEGRSVAGAVVDVAREYTYSAALGHGATRSGDGTRTDLRCTDIESVSMALVATGFGYGAARRTAQGELIGALLPRVRDIRRIGSAALDLCMVASGQVDAHFEHGLSPWDWAAGALIAAEAGAHVHLPTADSMSAAGDVVVAVAPGIASELGAIFDEIGAYAPIPDA